MAEVVDNIEAEFTLGHVKKTRLIRGQLRYESFKATNRNQPLLKIHFKIHQ